MRTIPLHRAAAPWPSFDRHSGDHPRPPDHEQRIEAMAAQVTLYLGPPRMNKGGGSRGRRVVLERVSDGRRFEFATMGAACAFVKVRHTSIYDMLRREHGVVLGYRWRMGKRR